MSYSDVNCPYCNEPQEILHDEGQGYEEDRTHQQDCGDCDKTFVFTTSIIYCYEEAKADCLNGSEHDYRAIQSYPRCWPNWVRCFDCDHEIRGEYKDPDRSLTRGQEKS